MSVRLCAMALVVSLPLVSGCSFLGDVFLPPNTNTAKDDAKLALEFECVSDPGQMLAADVLIGVALKVVSAGLAREAERFSAELRGMTSPLVTGTASCPRGLLSITVWDEEAGTQKRNDWKARYKLAANADNAAQMASLVKADDAPYFRAAFFAVPTGDDANSGMRLVLDEISIRKSQAKATALSLSGPWGWVWPWMWFYELGGLIAGGPDYVREIEYGVEVAMNGVGSSNGLTSLVPLGSAKVRLGKHRDIGNIHQTGLAAKALGGDPFATDASKLPNLPVFAWPSDSQRPMAINVEVQLTQVNKAGKVWATLGGLLGDNAKDITGGITEVFGLDDDGDGTAGADGADGGDGGGGGDAG